MIIKSKPNTEDYEANYDAIFKSMEVTNKLAKETSKQGGHLTFDDPILNGDQIEQLKAASGTVQ
jgi:hypothetical protein